jgi:hypothetical protein
MAETNKILNHNPLGETDDILRKEYYGRDSSDSVQDEQPATAKPRKAKKPKPTHYKVVCISLYTRDIENLEAKVAELKRRGHTKANKSQLIRYALNQLDLDEYPEPQP